MVSRRARGNSQDLVVDLLVSQGGTNAMATAYIPSLKENIRVRLTRAGHREDSQPATLIRALDNPSKRPENQWYDIRFDNGAYGRFLGRYLEPFDEETKNGGEDQSGLENLTAA